MEDETAEQILGRRIAELRRQRQWSQEELAVHMKAAGFPWRQTTVAKTEKADRPVRVNEASKLAELFDVPVEDLIRTARPPLLVRLSEAKQATLVQTMYIREADMRLVYARGRFDAIESLVTYWRNPSKEALRQGVRMVIYDCDDWRELLADAEIPAEVLSEVTSRANARLKDGEPLLEGEEDVKDQLVRLVTEGLLDWFDAKGKQGDGEH